MNPYLVGLGCLIVGFIVGHIVGMKEGRLFGRADAESESLQKMIREEFFTRRPS